MVWFLLSDRLIRGLSSHLGILTTISPLTSWWHDPQNCLKSCFQSDCIYALNRVSVPKTRCIQGGEGKNQGFIDFSVLNLKRLNRALVHIHSRRRSTVSLNWRERKKSLCQLTWKKEITAQVLRPSISQDETCTSQLIHAHFSLSDSQWAEYKRQQLTACL